MTLTVAIQMDHVASIDISGDSTKSGDTKCCTMSPTD